MTDHFEAKLKEICSGLPRHRLAGSVWPAVADSLERKKRSFGLPVYAVSLAATLAIFLMLLPPGSDKPRTTAGKRQPPAPESAAAAGAFMPPPPARTAAPARGTNGLKSIMPSDLFRPGKAEKMFVSLASRQVFSPADDVPTFNTVPATIEVFAENEAVNIIETTESAPAFKSVALGTADIFITQAI